MRGSVIRGQLGDASGFYAEGGGGYGRRPRNRSRNCRAPCGGGTDVVVADLDLNSGREFDEGVPAISVVDEIESLGRRALGSRAT